MKKIVKYTYIICMMIILNSCNDDFLETFPTTKLSDDTFWQTEDDAISASIGIYNTLKDAPDYNPSLIIYKILGLNKWTDDCTTNWPNAFYNPIAIGSYDATNIYIERHWKLFYRMIRTCNVFLANIDSPTMDEDLRTRLKSETRFIRAYIYDQLVNLYGGVPLITKPLTLDELKVPRNSKEEVISFIINELKESAPNLPKSYPSSETGRITRGAAYALLSRVAIYEEKWSDAAKYALEVINLNSYGLFHNYEELFDTKNEDNEEVIFDLQFYGEKNTSPAQTYINPRKYGGWGGLCVLKSLVDEYECTDGKTIEKSLLYDPNNPFENRDPRLGMSILYDGCIYRGEEYKVIIDGVLDTRYGGRTGYGVRKLLTEEFTSGEPNTTNIILIRYAEVLLNYAEAKIEQGVVDQSVLDVLNSIRARAYGVEMGDTENYPAITTFNQDELREIVRRERRVELAFEGNRFMDIRRWKIAEDVMTGPIFGAKVGDNYVQLETRNFEQKHYLWPIPQREIDLMGSDVLKQNSGW